MSPSAMDTAERRLLRKGMLEELRLNGEAKLRDAQGINGLAGGLKAGKVSVEGDVADYFGILNAGAELRVDGSAGRYVGDNMTDGMIVISGDAGDGAGDYCYGGTCHVKGSAGDFVGTMNKGGTIVIGGDVGHNVGTYMAAGEIIVMGSSGASLGNYIIRGAIYILGKEESLGENAVEERMSNVDFDRLSMIFQRIGVKEDVKSFRKIVPLSSKPFYKEKAKADKEVRR